MTEIDIAGLRALAQALQVATGIRSVDATRFGCVLRPCVARTDGSEGRCDSGVGCVRG
jgi:hypothetical protein